MELTSFNLFAPELQSDPFPFYARMREAGLCRIDPMGFIAVSRYEDVQQVLKNPAVFSSAGFVEAFEPPWVGYNPGAHTMLSMDPPEHTKNRTLVNKAFTGPTLNRLEPIVRELVGSLIDGLLRGLDAKPARDFIDSFAMPLTAGVIGNFLGLDPTLHGRFKEWSDTLASVTPTPRDEAHVAQVHHCIAEMTEYLASVLAQRRKQGGADLVSALIQAEIDGRRLDEKELVAFLVLLLVAGLETTVHLISKGTLLLSDRPELHDRLRADPALVPRFVEEMLRWDPPTHAIYRVTKQPTQIGGVTVPQGAFVMVLLAAANRDPAAFPNPDQFDLDRTAGRHVAFGHGSHLCIGLALARLEGRLAFEALTSRFRRFERAEERIPWNHTLTVRGPARLLLRIEV